MIRRILRALTYRSWDDFVPGYDDLATGCFHTVGTLFIWCFPTASFTGWLGWSTCKLWYEAIENLVWK